EQRPKIWHPSATIAFSSDGRTLISADPDGGIKLWDKMTGKQVQQKELHLRPGWARKATLAPGGKILAVWESSATVYIYETITGQELRRIAGSEGGRMPTWIFEPGHTVAGFCVRHMMVTWVHSRP